MAAAAAGVARASGAAGDVNSRLRNDSFLRRQRGPDELALSQFFLSQRSECPEREGKSPAELLTGQPQGHWLKLWGETRFAPDQ